MSCWMDCAVPDDFDYDCGDRIIMIVMERPHEKAEKSPRLVILEAAENGWYSPDPTYSGYSPEDGVCWAWEKDVCRLAKINSN